VPPSLFQHLADRLPEYLTHWCIDRQEHSLYSRVGKVISYIYVLPKGIELIEAFNESFQKVEDGIVQPLTEAEKQTLKELLIKVNQHL
jgi:DNA-binding MarR family transcriptional regulator